jgi:imidazoleglycerol phosphate dehydratase HisB
LTRIKTEVEFKGSQAKVSIDLDGSGKVNLSSGSSFLDHMLHAFSRTAIVDLKAQTNGDYYLGEVLGSAIGKALDRALGDRNGIRRYGSSSIPMDESLANVSLDFSGRPYVIFTGEFQNEKIGDLDSQQIKSFLEALAYGARLTLHINFYGENDHHKAESIFKALGFAVREAMRKEGSGIPSTKGLI